MQTIGNIGYVTIPASCTSPSNACTSTNNTFTNYYFGECNTINISTIINYYYGNVTTTNTTVTNANFININTNCTVNGWVNYRPISLKERLNQIIQSRCSPNIKTNRKSLTISGDIREQRARETLRRVIGNEKFINYLKSGFISVKAKSGLVYQIFSGDTMTNVYDKGKHINKLCAVLSGSFPATDSLIVRYLLILNNEKQFNDLSIKHSHSLGINPYSSIGKNYKDKSLNEIFKELKMAA